MSDRPTCSTCGRFFKHEPGVAWMMVYSGAIPMPDREIYRCKPCVDKVGPFVPQLGIKPEFSCGMVSV